MTTRRILGALVGVAVAFVAVGAVGLVVSGRFSNPSGLPPFTLQETLPKMVKDFGSGARVVEIIVSSEDVTFQVIAADRQLHIRNYEIVSSEIEAGTTGYNRETKNFVRRPTNAESRQASLTLGQIPRNVVDGLYQRVGFPRNGSGAMLEGRLWLLGSGVRPLDQYVADYDGSGLHLAKSDTDPLGTATATPAPSQPPPVSAKTTTVYSYSTTIGSSGSGETKATKRLLACIERARGDIKKIAACQQRFLR
jgi:hypothetical protein